MSWTPAGKGRTVALLEISGLRTYFYTSRGVAHAVDDVNLSIQAGTVMGLVGETGAGKSVTAYSILRLVPPPGRIVGGRIKLEGRNLLDLTEEKMNNVRGKDIGIIFQNPRESLNPTMRIGDQLHLGIRAHQGLNRSDSRPIIESSLEEVRLPRPDRVMSSYPHELSGGMCQRVLIALALLSSPKLLIADEATTKLDVTIQFQIITLLQGLREAKGVTEIIITHDLGVIAELCDHVAVMYFGQIVELAPVVELFRNPLHPYTVGLLAARPKISAGRLPQPMPGESPDILEPPQGCRFLPRCRRAEDFCSQRDPVMLKVGPEHSVRCLLYGE